jgi:hypothetical protein
MQAYFRESEARAMTLGNRGPIRFAGGDHQEGGRGGEFFLDERDGTER